MGRIWYTYNIEDEKALFLSEMSSTVKTQLYFISHSNKTNNFKLRTIDFSAALSKNLNNRYKMLT